MKIILIPRWLSLSATVVVLSASTASAQRAAPAAVVRRQTPVAAFGRAPSDSTRSLLYHVKRGAVYGAVSGAIVSGVGFMLVVQDGQACCDRTPTRITFGRSLTVLSAGTAVGALLGAMLGYGYHFDHEAHR